MQNQEDGQDQISLLSVPSTKISNAKAIKELGYLSLGCLSPKLVRDTVLFTNAIMLARVDQNVRPATALLVIFSEFSSIIPESISSYTSTSVSRLNNESDNAMIGQVAHASCVLALCCSIPQMILILMNKPILELCGQEEKLTALTDEFFKIFVISIPLTNIHLIGEELMLATGHMYAPTISQILAGTASIFSAYALIYGEWGAPRLSIAGMAWSCLIAAAVNTAFFLSYFSIPSESHDDFVSYHLFTWKQEGFFDVFKNLVINGIPLLVILVSEVGAIYVVNLLAGLLGKNELSAQLVTSQYQNILLIPIIACANATQITIAHSLIKNKQNIMKYGNAGIILSLIVPGIYTISSFIIPKTFIAPFVDFDLPDNEDLLQLLLNNQLLFIAGIQSSLTALRVVSGYALVGADYINWPLVLNASLAWLGVVFGYLLAFQKDYGVLGLNLGFTGGLLISAIAQASYWYYTAGFLSSQAQEDHSARTQLDEKEHQQPLLFSSRTQETVIDKREKPLLFFEKTPAAMAGSLVPYTPYTEEPKAKVALKPS